MSKQQTISILGTAIASQKVPGAYAVREKAIIGKEYLVKCPVCQQWIQVMAKTEKPWIETCVHCKTKIMIRGQVAEDAESSPSSTSSQKDEEATPQTHPKTAKVCLGKRVQASGKIVWGGFLHRKSYVLHEGENYIGRHDDQLPSDISIDDDYVSRRSILIEVKPTTKGYNYKLVVERCTNPVLINGQEQKVGNSIYLNYGDTILVGNTTLTFKAEQK